MPAMTLGQESAYLVNDAHFHLTNYVQQGTDIRDFLKIMGTKVYDLYAPLFARLTPPASDKLRKGNHERLFDQARLRVRAGEKANAK
jgi:hypothetical protein